MTEVSKTVKSVSNELGKVERIPDSLDKQMEMAQRLIKSDLVPYQKAEDCLIILKAAKDLGISFTFAMSNIHLIQKKITLGVHLIEAMLLSSGIHYEIIEDYVPVTHFITRGRTPLILSSDELIEGFEKYEIITTTQWTAGEYDKTKLPVIRVNAPYIDEDGVSDRRTTIRFFRTIQKMDGTFKELEHEYTYYLHQAYQAGYIGASVTNSKDNWYNHQKSMMYSRALTGGGRRIGSDVMGGFMETNEAADTFGETVILDADGKTIASIEDPNRQQPED